MNSEKSWASLGLSDALLELIKKNGYEHPTSIQVEGIPVALAGKDLIASAQTGTGKTAVFVLPMIEKFHGREGTFGLILAPTREIAQQINATIDLFGAPRGVRSAVLIGGIDLRLDLTALQSYPQIIVATPGRLCDHIERGNIWLDYVETVVLDEADRMLDMGFSDQLARIMNEVPKKRQTLLFSATINPTVDKLAHRILHDPARVAIGNPVSTAKSVEQYFLFMKEESKGRELRKLLRREPGSVMVFTRSKDGASRVWRSLHSSGFYDATYIHSNALQSHREQALVDFKSGKARIIVATDVAGRGIHVDDVAHVVNYDLPMEAEDYVHRIGRTGRAGATGKATTFLTSRDRNGIRGLERVLGHPIQFESVDGASPSSPPERGREGGGGGGPRRDGPPRRRRRSGASHGRAPAKQNA